MFRRCITFKPGLLVLALASFAASCNRGTPLVIEGYHLGPTKPAKHFVAGAGKEEITPYPGIPLGGHGPGGRIARGTWMPLYARAFYFQDDAGHAAALVSCDLFAVSAGLRAKVLYLVNRQVRLAPSELILSATHTHHGPANFASAGIYNGFGGPLPDFDEKVFDFLALRITGAIVQAVKDAYQHAGDDEELLLYSGYALGIQRNRAIAPFYRNPEGLIKTVQKESYAAGSRCPDGLGMNCPRYLSTDPTLKTLEIRRKGARSALLVFYAVHPTAMSHDNELYSPDFTGLAMNQLESEQSGLIAGFFNGAEGDVSPNWRGQDRSDVLKFSEKLSASVRSLLTTHPVAQSSKISITISWNRAAQQSEAWKAARFSDSPAPGAGEVGGAEDGRTVFYNYGFRGEARKKDGSSDPKLPALKEPLNDFVTALDLGSAKPILSIFGVHSQPHPDSFPMEFPVAQVAFAPVAKFATIPVEATTLVGRKIRESLEGQPIVIGLANEYFGYVTTPDEYQLQQYEGGSTELGQCEADGIIYLLQNAQPDKPLEYVDQQTFYPGKRRQQVFGPTLPLLRTPRNMMDDDLQPLYPKEFRWLESRVPRFAWTEDKNGDDQPGSRSASVYAGNTLVASDRNSTDLLTVFDGASGDSRRYAALWVSPNSSNPRMVFYFRITTGDGQTVCSEPFRIDSLAVTAPPDSERLGQCPP